MTRHNSFHKTIESYQIPILYSDVKKFRAFAALRFADLQNHGDYLTDIPINSLVYKARRIFYRETYEMWKKYEARR